MDSAEMLSIIKHHRQQIAAIYTCVAETSFSLLPLYIILIRNIGELKKFIFVKMMRGNSKCIDTRSSLYLPEFSLVV